MLGVGDGGAGPHAVGAGHGPGIHGGAAYGVAPTWSGTAGGAAGQATHSGGPHAEHVEASWARVSRWYAHVASVWPRASVCPGQHQVAGEFVEDLARALQTCGQWQHHIGQFGAAE
jgi:hypothetical protein